MNDRDRLFTWKVLFALLTLLLLVDGAKAYVGPGPEFIGYFASLATWLGVAFSALFLWPIYALLRRFRGRRDAPKAESPGLPTSTAAGDPPESTVPGQNIAP